MTRLNIVLLLAVIASALYLVRTSYEARRLVDAVESERRRETVLQTVTLRHLLTHSLVGHLAPKVNRRALHTHLPMGDLLECGAEQLANVL